MKYIDRKVRRMKSRSIRVIPAMLAMSLLLLTACSSILPKSENSEPRAVSEEYTPQEITVPEVEESVEATARETSYHPYIASSGTFTYLVNQIENPNTGDEYYEILKQENTPEGNETVLYKAEKSSIIKCIFLHNQRLYFLEESDNETELKWGSLEGELKWISLDGNEKGIVRLNLRGFLDDIIEKYPSISVDVRMKVQDLSDEELLDLKCNLIWHMARGAIHGYERFLSFGSAAFLFDLDTERFILVDGLIDDANDLLLGILDNDYKTFPLGVYEGRVYYLRETGLSDVSYYNYEDAIYSIGIFQDDEEIMVCSFDSEMWWTGDDDAMFFSYVNDGLYYSYCPDHSNGAILYRLDLSTGSVSEVCLYTPNRGHDYAVIGNEVYYMVEADLYCCLSDGTNSHLVIEGDEDDEYNAKTAIAAIDGYIYYMDGDSDVRQFHRIAIN